MLFAQGSQINLVVLFLPWKIRVGSGAKGARKSLFGPSARRRTASTLRLLRRRIILSFVPESTKKNRFHTSFFIYPPRGCVYIVARLSGFLLLLVPSLASFSPIPEVRLACLTHIASKKIIFY